MFNKHKHTKKFIITMILVSSLSLAGFAATTYFFGVLNRSANIGTLTTASQNFNASMKSIQDALTSLTGKFNTEQQQHQDDLNKAQDQIKQANDNIKAANAAIDAANTALTDPTTGVSPTVQQAAAANANANVLDRTIDVNPSNAITTPTNP